MSSSEIRIVFLADTHLGFDYPVRPRVQMRRRGEDFFENFQKVLDFAEHTRPDLVIHGGDLFFRSRVPQVIVDLAYEKLHRFAQSGIPLFIVPGNHERSRLPASLLLTDANIHVFDRPGTYMIDTSCAAVAISGFPFIRDDVSARFNAVLSETAWAETRADIKLLCMHQVVEGATVGPSDYTFRSGPDVLKRSAIPEEFAATLSGHIHRKQILLTNGASGRKPIIYAGSIERTSFAEQHEDKGFFEITFSQEKAGSWKIGKIAFIGLPTRPMVDIELDSDLSAERLIADLCDKVAAIPEDSIIRLGTRGELTGSAKSVLTAPFLRSILPPSMNCQLRASIYLQGDADDDLE
jgi:DNA repair protein SbcD/Mre11